MISVRPSEAAASCSSSTTSTSVPPGGRSTLEMLSKVARFTQAPLTRRAALLGRVRRNEMDCDGSELRSSSRRVVVPPLAAAPAAQER